MRVQCDNCTFNLAAVMCCADEAALCTPCDLRIHAANKVSSKHQRVPLFPTTENPTTCDICQEKRAFFFCLEDRALLCRDCDVSIHLPNSLSATHQRFLLTGTRVALEALPNNLNSDYSDEFQSGHVPNTPGCSGAHSGAHYDSGRFDSRVEGWMEQQYGGYAHTVGAGAHGHDLIKKTSFGSELTSDAVPTWKVDEFLDIPDLAEGYTLADIGSSKAETDLAPLGDFDWTADLSLFDEQVYAESLHEVPQLPPAGLGVGMGMGRQQNPLKGRPRHDMVAVVPDFDDSFLVPDLGLDCLPPVSKKRRNGYGYM